MRIEWEFSETVVDPSTATWDDRALEVYADICAVGTAYHVGLIGEQEAASVLRPLFAAYQEAGGVITGSAP